MTSRAPRVYFCLPGAVAATTWSEIFKPPSWFHFCKLIRLRCFLAPSLVRPWKLIWLEPTIPVAATTCLSSPAGTISAKSSGLPRQQHTSSNTGIWQEKKEEKNLYYQSMNLQHHCIAYLINRNAAATSGTSKGMIWRASTPCQEVSNKTIQLEFGQTAAISTKISISCHWFVDALKLSLQGSVGDNSWTKIVVLLRGFQWYSQIRN